MGLPFPHHRPRRKSGHESLISIFHSLSHFNFTSTSHHSTQLISTHFWTLRGLHFGALWPPKSAQDRPKSPLDTLLFQKRRFSKKTSAALGESTILGAKSPQDGTRNDPRSPQDGSKTIFKTFFFRLRFCLRFWSVLGPILASSWPPLGRPKGAANRELLEGEPKRCG